MTKLNVTNDEFAKALGKGKEESQPCYKWGIVTSINSNGHYGVKLDGATEITDCIPCCYAEPDDRVLTVSLHRICHAIAKSGCPHCVGDIWMTTTSVDPATRWPGTTWTKVENKFLLGSGSRAVGATGGAETVTLTTSQIPAHSHKPSTNSNWRFHLHYSVSTSEVSRHNYSAGSAGYTLASTNIDYLSEASATANTGGGGSHENMPPFEVVNIWKRTA